MRICSGAVCALGLGIVGIFSHVERNVMSDPECVPEEVGRPKSKTATSMGLAVSIHPPIHSSALEKCSRPRNCSEVQLARNTFPAYSCRSKVSTVVCRHGLILMYERPKYSVLHGFVCSCGGALCFLRRRAQDTWRTRLTSGTWLCS